MHRAGLSTCLHTGVRGRLVDLFVVFLVGGWVGVRMSVGVCISHVRGCVRGSETGSKRWIGVGARPCAHNYWIRCTSMNAQIPVNKVRTSDVQ